MGIAEVLTLVFVIFKLLGIITWSWWLVFLPMIIVYSIVLSIIFLGFLAVVIFGQ